VSDENILYILPPFEGEEFEIELCPDGQAFVMITPDSLSQRTGVTTEDHLKNAMFPPAGLKPRGKFVQARYPIVIPDRLAEKMRQIVNIEDSETNEAARSPVDDALLALFVSQVVPRMRRAE
jgi:hypothetical protein